MKLLYTVQRYGEDIVGGSEAACRLFAERLAERGHSVEVVTSCAHSYVDWADEYEPGTTELNGVTVHRLPVTALRTVEEFGPLNEWTILGPRPIPLFQQQRWMRLMGPQLRGYPTWLRANARSVRRSDPHDVHVRHDDGRIAGDERTNSYDPPTDGARRTCDLGAAIRHDLPPR